jgi:hypothetical protein
MSAPVDAKKFCAICASRRQRDLVLYEKYSICVRCYVYYIIVKKSSLPSFDLERTYDEAKKDDMSPSFRYGAYMDSKEEKMLVNRFRLKFAGRLATKKSIVRTYLEECISSRKANPGTK